ncbi:hypothetical protein ABBQ32_007164 [Trebouxia sp. C0010 RCD-2024]
MISEYNEPGLGNTVMFCGDGINDLAALRAADIGFAVGATDATIAASLSTHQRSVAGTCQFIKEGKARHSLLLSVFKYLVVYNGILSASNNISFFVDGSQFSYLQNPVNTLMWLGANFSLIGPIISLAIDTKLFVRTIFRGPLLFLSIVNVGLASAGLMAGPAKHANILQLYCFPQLFRFQVEGLGAGGWVFFYIFITLTRYVLRQCQSRKVVPS